MWLWSSTWCGRSINQNKYLLLKSYLKLCKSQISLLWREFFSEKKTPYRIPKTVSGSRWRKPFCLKEMKVMNVIGQNCKIGNLYKAIHLYVLFLSLPMIMSWMFSQVIISICTFLFSWDNGNYINVNGKCISVREYWSLHHISRQSRPDTGWISLCLSVTDNRHYWIKIQYKKMVSKASLLSAVQSKWDWCCR